MFRKKRADGDFAEEIRSHLELEADELQAEGVSRDEAERRAHVAFGNVATAREQFRLRRRWAWLASISQDLRFAIRKLRKSPGFAAVAIATLALGIGANAVVFSVLNALVLTPLNVPRAQSLYMVQQVVHGQSLPSQSYPDYLDLRDRNQSFQSLAACAVVGAVGLNTGGGNPSVVWPYLVSGNYFRVLGVHPYLGRFFGPSDVHGQNSAPYIVLAYDYWKSHFHADPAAVGRIVQVNKHPYTILGVAPPGFRGTLLFFAPDFFAPIMDMPQIGSFTTNYNPLDDRSDPLAWVVGHLKPRVTPGQATADLNTLAASLARSYPKTDTGLTFSLARPGLAGDTLGRPARAFLAGLMLLAVSSGVFFGMVPVRQILRTDPWRTLRSGGSGFGALRRFTVRDVLLSVQIALCAVLVTASLVAVRGLERSLHSNFGFRPANTLIAEADLHMGGYSGDSAAMEKRIVAAASRIPGVTAAGYTDRLPLAPGGGGGAAEVYRDSATEYRPTDSIAQAQDFDVSSDYFRAAGTALLAGRDLTLHDDSKAPMVAVINEDLARRLFGSVGKAIGGWFKIWWGTRVQVVGVVENGKYSSLTEDQQPAIFLSFLQHPSPAVYLVVRSRRDPREIAETLRQTLRGLDPGLPARVVPWEQELSLALFPARVAAIALGVLGLIGVLLAVTGIFGMASYVVSKRLREFGIRVALGAGQREVLRAALGRAFRLLAVGSAAGIVLGVLASQVLAHIVYDATSKDPLVLGGVVLTMLLLGLLATWIPARRALAVDPMILLRDE